MSGVFMLLPNPQKGKGGGGSVFFRSRSRSPCFLCLASHPLCVQGGCSAFLQPLVFILASLWQLLLLRCLLSLPAPALSAFLVITVLIYICKFVCGCAGVRKHSHALASYTILVSLYRDSRQVNIHFILVNVFIICGCRRCLHRWAHTCGGIGITRCSGLGFTFPVRHGRE